MKEDKAVHEVGQRRAGQSAQQQLMRVERASEPTFQHFVAAQDIDDGFEIGSVAHDS